MISQKSTPPIDASPRLSQRGRPVRIEKLTKQFGENVAVNGVDLDIHAGELLTLLGASGSGKSTLLSMIAGFTTPTSGTVTVAGDDITGIPPHRRNIGMVFQQYSLFPHMSVLVNVEFPLKQRGVSRAERRRLAMQALEVVELSQKADARPTELSGGQQQRIALARALVFSPTVLLMDEPFGALDRALRERMQEEVRRIHRDLGVTIVFVTHDQQEALTMSDRIAVFERGRIEQLGTPEDLYDSPGTLHVATFLGESNVLPGVTRQGVLTTEHGVRLPAGDAADGTGRLVVRPERITVGPSASSGSATVDGTVSDVVYLGTDRRIVATTAVGELIARVPATDSTPAPGEPVTLSWAPDGARYFLD
ncbi:ABC transporter ATP-binding protein [Mycolicibacterium sp. 624]|uniref:ABC transporter ATP-binding protein n=1 Tax=Mycolicibacterium sp. 624 TaxID=3156314 RepID=UPI0033922A8F